MNRVYLVRHGENPANLLKQFSHKLVDHSLTPKGVVQSQQTAAFFRDKGVDAIYSSPLRRARETADIIGKELNLPVEEVEEFREINVGRLESEPPSAENWNIYFQIARDWFEGRAESGFPEGENYHQLLDRMQRGLAQALEGRENQTVVVVAHGGIFIATIKDLCPNIDRTMLLTTENHNCSISELLLEHHGDGFRGELVDWAACQHLSGDAAEFVIAVPDEHSAASRRGEGETR